MSSRLPFDPRRVPVPPSEAARLVSAAAPLSVRQVNELVRGAVLRHVPSTLHVVGEIGEFSRPGSGHIYLTLKDRDSELRCVIWRSVAAGLRFAIQAGLEVIVSGEIEVYTPRGTYQLVARSIEPRGVGALDLAFRQLRERLGREGLFDAARKRPIPRFCFRIAVVTSPTGAAVRDVLRTLHRRFSPADVLICPAKVQGAGAALEVASAISDINRWAERLGGIDVLIVARGGGSPEDLWAFNEEPVVRAVAASRIPVVSGVGHEVDVTLCDLAADLRAATPTAAAEAVTPDLSTLQEHVTQLARRSERLAAHALAIGRERLRSITARPPMAQPLARWQDACRRREELQRRLRHALAETLRAARGRLAAAMVRIGRCGPEAQLSRAESRLERIVRRLDGGWALVARDAERRIALLALRLEHSGPNSRLRMLRERLQSGQIRAAVAMRTLVQRSEARLRATQSLMESCYPRNVLKRGYAIVREQRGRRIIRTIQQVRPRRPLLIEVSDGEFPVIADDPRQMRLF